MIKGCPKNMVNGPCSSYKDNLCENNVMECPWVKAYQNMREISEEEKFFKLRFDPDFKIKDYYPVTRRPSNLIQTLSENSLKVLYEVYVPKYHNIIKHVRYLKELNRYVDYYVIPDSPFALHTPHPITLAEILKKEHNKDVIVEITCRDKTKEEFVRAITTLLTLDILNIIITTGDLPINGAPAHFELDSSRATYLSRLISDLGLDHSRKYVSFGAYNLTIGVVANPNSPYLRLEIKKTLRKIKAGANIVFTQLTYETNALKKFVKELRKLQPDVIVVPTFAPIQRIKDLHYLKNSNIKISKNLLNFVTTLLKEGRIYELNVTLLENQLNIISEVETSAIYLSTYGNIKLAEELLNYIKREEK